jgi:hypothetical protein
MGMNLNELAKSNKGSGGDRPKPKAGSQAARVVHVVDLGVQPRKPYMGKEKKPARMVWVNFELPNDKFDFKGEGKLEPHRISTAPMTASNDPKAALYKLMNSLDPQGMLAGDLTKLVNTPCLVTVVYNKQPLPDGSTAVYANLSQVIQYPDSIPVPVPPLSIEGGSFSFDSPDIKVWESLPSFIQEKIKGALNFKGSAVEKMLQEAQAAQPAVDAKAPY